MNNPGRKTYSSFVDEGGLKTSSSRKFGTSSKSKLQEAINVLPDFKTHWETLIGMIYPVYFLCATKTNF